jgi:hypothetical protein
MSLEEARKKARDPATFQGIGETIQKREQAQKQGKLKSPVVFPRGD